MSSKRTSIVRSYQHSTINYNKILITVAIYFLCSLPIFYKVNELAKIVIDEEFHLRQGKHYCSGRYDIWDPKITTFPGLYLISILLLPFKLCTTFYLRLINLIASAINLFLIWKIALKRNQNQVDSILEAVAINLLPPLYFFSHLYYTDILSVTCILLLIEFWSNDNNFTAFFAGFCGILMRQTNIIWICFIFGINLIEELEYNFNVIEKRHKIKIKNFKDISKLLTKSIINDKNFLKTFVERCRKHLLGYGILILGFGIFVLVNGSIVVGDKTAHTATLHLPQLLYFSLFASFFSIPSFLMQLYDILRNYMTKWILIGSLAIVIGIIVHYNTLVHPYLLADNRHYTFYIWNRFYGKYSAFKYVMIPAYILSIIFIIEDLKHQKISFKISWWICLVISLVLQKLFEIRYFIIPFLIFRLNRKPLRRQIILAEIFCNCIINAVTFYLFFSKEIYWQNYEEPQRLIW